MHLENIYWGYQSILPKRLCDDIIKYGNSKREELALTGNEGDKLNKNKFLSKKDIEKMKKKIRNSHITWFKNEIWIHREIYPLIENANKSAGWNFEWDTTEDMQFTKYKLNQYYDWHTDSGVKPRKDGRIRKLSVICALSDSSEYEGGEVLIDTKNSKKPTKKTIINLDVLKQKGSVVVFPSFLWHKVEPVTKGTRYSLVLWNLGYPFR